MLRIKQILSSLVLSNHSSFLRSNVKKCLRTTAALDSATNNKNQEVPTKNFKVIYSLDMRTIKFVHGLTRLKFYPLAFTAITVPGTLMLEYINQMPAHAWVSYLLTGVMASGAMFGALIPVRNMIGRIYISEDKSQIRFSFINFWGKRIDLDVPVEAVKILEPRFSFEPKLYVQMRIGDFREPVRLMKGKAKVDKVFTEIFGSYLI